MIREVTAVAIVNRTVFPALQYEGWDVNKRQDRPNIHFRCHFVGLPNGVRRADLTLKPDERLFRRDITENIRRKYGNGFTRSPCFRKVLHQGFLCWHEGIVFSRTEFRHRAMQYEAVHLFGICRCEQNTHRAAFGCSQKCRASTPGRVHNCAHVFHSLFKGGRTLDGIRNALSAFVKHDDTETVGQAFEEPDLVGILPRHLDVRDRSGHIDEIFFALPKYLIGDINSVAMRILGSRDVQNSELTSDQVTQMHSRYCVTGLHTMRRT